MLQLTGLVIRCRRQSAVAYARQRGAAAEGEAAGGREEGNLRRHAIVARQAAARTGGRLIVLKPARAAERRQDEHAPLGAVEFGGVSGVLQAVEVGFGKGVKAKQKRHLGDIGQSGEVAVVGAGRGARRIVVIVFAVRSRRRGRRRRTRGRAAGRGEPAFRRRGNGLVGRFGLVRLAAGGGRDPVAGLR